MIQVTYTYDLNDGLGEQTEVVTYAINSEAKTVPTVEINTVVPTQDSISFGITVTDPDAVGSITAIELYQGETLIEALTDLSVREFTGLLSDNAYMIQVTYTYDLNDGLGEQELVISLTCRTTVEKLNIVNVELMDINSLHVNMDMSIKIYVDAVPSFDITGFIINGNRYDVLLATSTYYLVKMSTGENSGEIHYTIEEFFYTQDQVEYSQTTIGSNTFTCEVFLKIEIVDIYIDSELNLLGTDADSTFYIDLANHENYTIDSISINSHEFSGDNIIYVDSDTIKLVYPTNVGWWSENFLNYQVQITDITYSSSTSTITLQDVSEIKSFYLMASSTPVIITTRTELESMIDGYYYILGNDIDLSGSNWSPVNLKGVLDGNGYAIINMEIFLQDENTSNVSVGLFKSYIGDIINLTLSDFTIFVETDGFVFAGGLLGSMSWGFEYNSDAHVSNSWIKDGTIIVNTTNYVEIGGLASIATSIENVIVENVMITVTSGSPEGTSWRYANIGGIVGETAYANQNAVFNVDIEILNSNPNYSVYVGGVAGGYNNTNVIITNNIFVGSITITNSTRIIYDYIVGEKSGTISNNYVFEGVSNDLVDYNQASLSDLNSSDFYINTLEWDINLYDFTNVDVTNGFFPKLKLHNRM